MRAIVAGIFALFVSASPGTWTDASEIEVGPGAIVGSVRDANGNPIANALVVASGPVLREARTSAAGIVTLQALPLGAYDVRVTHGGFVSYGTHVRLANARGTPTLLRLRLVPATFANLASAADASDAIALGTTIDPVVAHEIERAADADIVAVAGSIGSAPTVRDSSPNETRVELDGIPYPGDAAGRAALRFRSTLGLAEIDVLRGPFVATPTLRDAIGGVIAYRTPEIELEPHVEANAGYDSSFGAFEHVRANERFGRLGLLGDIVAGGGESRSQTFKAAYAFGGAASVGVAAYDARGGATLGSENVTADAPAFAADLRTALGIGTLEARTFESQSHLETSSLAVVRRIARTRQTSEDAWTNGTQIRYALPVGDARVTVGFDRRSDDATGPSRAFTTVTARANVALAPGARLELADAYGSGTQLARRHDPQLALALRVAPRTTLDLAAGSAYATAPDDLVRSEVAAGASSKILLAPETSFGYRLRFEQLSNAGDRTWIALDTMRRFDRFAALAEARSTSFEIGYEREIEPGRFGGGAYVRVRRSNAYGFAQSSERDAERLGLIAGSQSWRGAPATKARATFGYADRDGSFTLGATYLGAESALSAHAIVLGDARARFAIAGVARLGFGIENLFGAGVENPNLRSFYPPREITLTLGR